MWTSINAGFATKNKISSLTISHHHCHHCSGIGAVEGERWGVKKEKRGTKFFAKVHFICFKKFIFKKFILKTCFEKIIYVWRLILEILFRKTCFMIHLMCFYSENLIQKVLFLNFILKSMFYKIQNIHVKRNCSLVQTHYLSLIIESKLKY